MAPTPENIIIINGIKFKDVTNQTIAGKVFNYEEAVAYTKGEIINTYSERKSK